MEQWGYDLIGAAVLVVALLLVVRWRLMRSVRFRRRLEWQSIERKTGELSGYFIRQRSSWGRLRRYTADNSNYDTPMDDDWRHDDG